MAKPYQEGATWSMRTRQKGHDIYVRGFKSKRAAQKESDRRIREHEDGGKPKGNGPYETTLGQALQDYAMKRLKFLKGARQVANRINRYLRPLGLDTLVLEAVPMPSDPVVTAKPAKVKKAALPDDQDDDDDDDSGKWVRFKVWLEPAQEQRVVPPGLGATRKKREKATRTSDRCRRRLAGTAMAEVATYEVQEFIDALVADGLAAATGVVPNAKSIGWVPRLENHFALTPGTLSDLLPRALRAKATSAKVRPNATTCLNCSTTASARIRP